MKKIGWPGKGHKFACHRCGFWFPSTEIKKEWTGLLVCPPCWEPRHEQTLIKVHGEKAFPTFVSKDGTDTFVAYCDVATSSGYADLGTADCMQADNNRVPYADLLDMFGNGHVNPTLFCTAARSTAYADLGTADCMLANNNREPYATFVS